MIKCAFYGTLRSSYYNYNRMRRTFGLDSMKYRKTLELPGYDMYQVCEMYPGIKNSTPDRKIVVELFDVDPEAYNLIKAMEVSSGFYEDDVEIEGIIYRIFPYKRKVEEKDLIISGDWEKNLLMQKKCDYGD